MEEPNDDEPAVLAFLLGGSSLDWRTMALESRYRDSDKFGASYMCNWRVNMKEYFCHA